MGPTFRSLKKNKKKQKTRAHFPLSLHPRSRLLLYSFPIGRRCCGVVYISRYFRISYYYVPSIIFTLFRNLIQPTFFYNRLCIQCGLAKRERPKDHERETKRERTPLLILNRPSKTSLHIKFATFYSCSESPYRPSSSL